MGFNLINYKKILEIKEKIKPNAQLMVVTKNRNIETIKEALKEGHSLFGENKVQEADKKFTILRNSYKNIDLHLIGPLQTNKVSQALMVFDTIQTIDREKLLREIIKVKKKSPTIRTKEFYIQINIGNEIQKTGINLLDLREFYNLCTSEKINISGLMCIPPLDSDPSFFFDKMEKAKKNLNNGLRLSMGMSNDFTLALKFDSNIIRVGSMLF